MSFIALPLFVIASAIQTTPNYETFTVTEVKVEERFAGQYGTRIRTELVLEAGGRRVTVHIQDVRHGRFQKADSPWLKGHQVRIPEVGTRSEIVLRPDQVEVTGYILPPNEIPKMYWVLPGSFVGIPIPAEIASPGTS
ncbi:MAG: hypothetical protein IH944_05295 [Armatimonadetes bacterium]|nr:hypothetical protein [Armatimonadota bacterium]